MKTSDLIAVNNIIRATSDYSSFEEWEHKVLARENQTLTQDLGRDSDSLPDIENPEVSSLLQTTGLLAIARQCGYLGREAQSAINRCRDKLEGMGVRADQRSAREAGGRFIWNQAPRRFDRTVSIAVERYIEFSRAVRDDRHFRAFLAVVSNEEAVAGRSHSTVEIATAFARVDSESRPSVIIGGLRACEHAAALGEILVSVPLPDLREALLFQALWTQYVRRIRAVLVDWFELSNAADERRWLEYVTNTFTPLVHAVDLANPTSRIVFGQTTLAARLATDLQAAFEHRAELWRQKRQESLQHLQSQVTTETVLERLAPRQTTGEQLQADIRTARERARQAELLWATELETRLRFGYD